MCGISGFVRTEQAASAAGDRSLLRDMNRAQAHRGPDDQDFLATPNAGLAHCRLAILDLQASRQPMATANQQCVLSYNGEIYNYRELRRELRQLGFDFATEGDTEVILRGYEAWGDDVVRRLRGMFAFAIWDAPRQRLLLARDQLGVKPLYYAEHPGGLVFGSELKTLLLCPEVPRRVSLDAVSLYLESQYIPTPHTIYESVRKLPAGHLLVWRQGSSRLQRYWDYSCSTEQEYDGWDHAADALLERLRDSVRGMLVSDVPLGAFVSGGVDSGLLLALMTEASPDPVPSFHLGFQGDHACSEHDQAAAVARHLGARHHCLRIAPRDLLGELEHYVEHYDEPFGDQAALPTMMLSRLTRQHVKVVLSGEGADEVFGGYANYARFPREDRIRGMVRRAAPLLKWVPQHWRRDRYLRGATLPVAECYTSQSRQFAEETHATLYTDAFRRSRTRLLRHVSRDHYLACDAVDGVERLMFVDKRLWLPDNLLTKVDRATMAYSLEARVPYLDHPLVEFAAGLHPRWKCDRGETKVLLKHLACRYLPTDLVRRKKQGFRLPLDEWLRTDLADFVRDALGPQGLGRRGLLQPQAVQRLLARQAAGRNLAGRLWTLLMLELWFRRYEPDFVC